MVMTFDYYYGAQAEQFNFIRIPKAMIVLQVRRLWQVL